MKSLKIATKQLIKIKKIPLKKAALGFALIVLPGGIALITSYYFSKKLIKKYKDKK